MKVGAPNSIGLRRCILVQILFFLLIASPTTWCRADLYEDQRKALKDQRDKAVIEVNRKYSEQLAILLDKVKANKDEAMAIKIRQEMLELGFPHKDDWILGTWIVDHSDDFKRTYVFAANGSVRMTRYKGATTVNMNSLGSYLKQEDGSYRVTFEKSLLFFSRSPQGGVVVTRWNDIKDYPDKVKMIKGTAKSRTDIVYQ